MTLLLVLAGALLVIPSGARAAKLTVFGTCTQPWDITAGRDGYVWWICFYGDTISRRNSNGDSDSILVIGLSPKGLTWGSDGHVWFAEDARNNLARIDGYFRITEFPIPSGRAEDLTSGPDGNLWFTFGDESEKIGRMTTAGDAIAYPIPSRRPAHFIAAGPDGNLWFTMDDAIGKITTSGEVTEYELGPENHPAGITAGPDGNIWITDDGRQAIIRMTTSGEWSEFLLPRKVERQWPYGIVSGPGGHLWFTESGRHSLARITVEGLITEFRPRGPDLRPTAITVGPDRQSLWYVESDADNVVWVTPD